MRITNTCTDCGKGLSKQSVKKTPLRFDVSNGETLCLACHKKTDSYLNSKGRNQYVRL